VAIPVNRSAQPGGVKGAEEPAILTVGRVNFDLYVADAGVSIENATSYVASVGGSPANIAMVARRFGIPSAVLSATGSDDTGRFVRSQLQREGVSTRWLAESPTGSTSLALLATLGPDRGERQFYRRSPADATVEPGVVARLPWASLRAVVVSADALAMTPMAQTAAAVAQTALDRHLQVWWDLDLRPSSWTSSRPYRDTVPTIVDGGSVVIGTEEEFAAFFGLGEFTLDAFKAGIRDRRLTTVVLKRGPRGAALFLDGEAVLDVPARATDPVCTVGAGDATAGALLAARIAGRTWPQALDLAMDAAAWTVQQPYCSTGFPTAAELGIDPLVPAAEVGLR
jgi:5-dehydro-2-deoxygluconokinase